jgi:4-hydroxy-tetrahydrodipicolinate reductase
LKHSVADRGVFAAGALMAASWLTRQPPGLYGMRDLVRAASGGQPSRDSVK